MEKKMVMEATKEKKEIKVAIRSKASAVEETKKVMLAKAERLE